MQHDESHAQQHALMHTLHHRVVDVVVSNVTPPGEDVGRRQNLFRQAVLRLIKRRRAHVRARSQSVADSFGDGGVHAARIVGLHGCLVLLVQVPPRP